MTASACDPSNRTSEGSSVGHANNRTSPLSRPTARDAPSVENAAHLTSHVASVTRVAVPTCVEIPWRDPVRRGRLGRQGVRLLRLGELRGRVVGGDDVHGDVAGEGDEELGAVGVRAQHLRRGLVGVHGGEGSVSSTESNEACITRFGMPLLFLPPPPATSATRSSIHAEA